MEQISNLTVRQISFLYYRPRDKETGKGKTLPYYYASKQDKKIQQRAMFWNMGKSLGKTEEEIQKMWDEAIKDG